MDNFNDDTFVSDKIKPFSDLLRSRYGARGRGLGEEVDSVANKLPISLVLAIRRLAQIRNKIVKDRLRFPISEYDKTIDRDYFEKLAAEVESNFQRVFSPNTSTVYFSIVNKMSGKVLDLAWSTDEGGLIHQWEFHGGNNQLWSLKKIDNEFYSIVSKHSGKCVEIAEGSYDEGIKVQQWSYAGFGHQHWKFIEQSDGSYQIIARHSMKCLDAHFPKIYENGAAIVQWEWCNGENQKWWLKPYLQ